MGCGSDVLFETGILSAQSAYSFAFVEIGVYTCYGDDFDFTSTVIVDGNLISTVQATSRPPTTSTITFASSLIIVPWGTGVASSVVTINSGTTIGFALSLDLHVHTVVCFDQTDTMLFSSGNLVRGSVFQYKFVQAGFFDCYDELDSQIFTTINVIAATSTTSTSTSTPTSTTTSSSTQTQT